MAMDRPEDIPQDVWRAAQDLWYDQLNFANDRMGAMPIVARAIIKAREDAFEEMKAVADCEFARPKGQDPWANGYRSAAAEILDAIRQHSQKGER
jgi:hypothetical protein